MEERRGDLSRRSFPFPLEVPFSFSFSLSFTSGSLGADSEVFLRRLTSAERFLESEELREDELDLRLWRLELFFLARESSELADLERRLRRSLHSLALINIPVTLFITVKALVLGLRTLALLHGATLTSALHDDALAAESVVLHLIYGVTGVLVAFIFLELESVP